MANADQQPTRHVAVPPPSRRGLSRVESAEYVGISPSKFDQLVIDGRMPAAKRIDGRRVWDVRTLDLAFDALPGEGEGERNEWDEVHAQETAKVLSGVR